MSWLRAYLVLPREITAFERSYLQRLNRIALWFLWLHVPVFSAVAALAGTHPLHAAIATSVVLIGPTLTYRTATNPRTMGLVSAFTAMVLGGLLVHFGQGPMQIEMHFYFFVLIALLAVFSNPMAVVVAAATATVHHLTVWLLVPTSVFNYDASVWTVAVHATFVVVESVAAVFVARSFFNNVIRLERNVAARTEALDTQTRDLRLVLESVGQGFMTIGLDGAMSVERSAILVAWLGAAPASENLFDYIEPIDSDVAGRMMLNWFELAAKRLPVASTLAVMPRKLRAGDRHLRLDYKPVGTDEHPDRILVVVSDITLELERDRAEAASRELVAVLDRLGKDRAGLVEFYDEAGDLVRALVADDSAGEPRPLEDIKRRIHTLKGNAGLFGVESLAECCHELESRMETDGKLPTAAERAHLAERWHAFSARLDAVLGMRADRRIEIGAQDLARVLDALRDNRPRAEIIAMVEDWRLEPVGPRLQRIAGQASRLAQRLGKDLRVEVKDDGVRLEPTRWAPFWSAFVHAVRNAVDHGIEDAPERASSGKATVGEVGLSASLSDGGLTIEIRDDGRGVNWEKIRDKASERGMPCRTHDDLVAAMVSDGVSTRDTVSEVSGRGVGLAALHAAAAASGGAMTVDSQPAAGTMIRFRFPREVSASPA